MTKQEFETKHKPLNDKINSLHNSLLHKYGDVIYGSDPDAKSKYGEDFTLYEEMMSFDKELGKLYNEYQHQELKKTRMGK